MLQLAPARDVPPAAAGIRELASSVIWLLQIAAKEVERDGDVAKSFIARASSLLQIEADRDAISDRDVRSGGLAPWQIHRVKAFIEEHPAGPIRVDNLSEVARLSATHFSRAFRRSFGEAPHAYLVRRRLHRCRHLMLTSDIALSELALACGFADQAHLCKLFRQTTGRSPAAWRRERREIIHSDPASSGCLQSVAA